MQLLQISNTANTIAGESTKAISATTNFINKILEYAILYTPKIVGAVIFYIIGSWVIKRIVKFAGAIMLKRKYDPSLQTFMMSFIKITLMLFLLVSIMGILGVDTTAFGAAIVGISLAIGSALNGSLGNFAGGVMMLFFKPFKVGEMIEAQGVTGTVVEQGIFNTVVLTADNKTVIVPNGPLSTGIITNYTTHGNLRVDLTMAIDPNMNIEKARAVAIKAMLSHPKVLQEPKPEVSVLKVADGMVSLAIRPYCTQADYWDVYFGVQELVKNAWDVNDIVGPIPHRVIISK